MKLEEQLSPKLIDHVENAIINGKAQIVLNQPYEVHIQKISDLVAQGVTEIYNKLEDAKESLVGEDGKPKEGYVVTGAAGEQWCIGAKHLPKYGLSTETNPPEGMKSVNDIPPEGMDVVTQPDGKVMIAIPTSAEMQGEVKTSWASLNLNAPETKDGEPIPHGDGDYILVNAVINPEDKSVSINREDSDARVVNGSIMNVLYREAEPEVLQQAGIIAELEQKKNELGYHLEAIENSGGAANLSAEKISGLRKQYAELSGNLETEKENMQKLLLDIKIEEVSAEKEEVKKELESLDFGIEMKQMNGKSVSAEEWNTRSNLNQRMEDVSRVLDTLTEIREAKESMHIGIEENKDPNNPTISVAGNGESYLQYMISADDRTLENFYRRSEIPQETGFESLEELLNNDSDSYAEMRVDVEVSKEGDMKAILLCDDIKYPVQMSEKELASLGKEMEKAGMCPGRDLEAYSMEMERLEESFHELDITDRYLMSEVGSESNCSKHGISLLNNKEKLFNKNLNMFSDF